MSQKYESHELYPDIVFGFYGDRRGWQTFTPQANHEITSVFLHGYRKGTAGNIHIRIRAADGNHKPTGDPLASVDTSANGWTTNTAGAWYELTLDAPANLDADTEYGIEVWCDGTGVTNLLNMQGTTSGNQYTRGIGGFSTTAGATWDMQALWDYAFQEWGNPIVNIPTVQTNDADGITHEEAKLHGTLTNDGGETCDVRFQYGETTAYGTDTAWQSGKVTEDTFEQLITGLDSEKTYHFRAQAKNSAGTASGADKEFQTPAPPPEAGEYRKISITHPALKTVRVIRAGQEQTKYDNLSNLDEGFIHGEIQLPVEVPTTVEVTTLANQIYKFNVT